MNEFLLVLFVAVLTPFVVFVSVKFGVYGYYCGTRLAKRVISPGDRHED